MELHDSALYTDPSSLDQSRRHFPPRLFDDSAECRPGHVHSSSRFLLGQALQVRESYRFKLIQGQHRQIGRLHRHGLGDEAYGRRIKADPTRFQGAGHWVYTPGKTVLSICS
jgi:hypothetical protein